MASSNHRIRFSLITVVALWAMSILTQCEATTVSLTNGPYSNSRRKSFGSSGWMTRRSQLAPALLEDDEFATENYKEVEECGVSLMDNFVSFVYRFQPLILFAISNLSRDNWELTPYCCHTDIYRSQKIWHEAHFFAFYRI